MSRLDSKPQIGKLASDLGLKRSDKPVFEIVDYVRRRVGKVVKSYKCGNLADLLDAAAQGTNTTKFLKAGYLRFRRSSNAAADGAKAGIAGIRSCIPSSEPYSLLRREGETATFMLSGSIVMRSRSKNQSIRRMIRFRPEVRNDMARLKNFGCATFSRR
jgi:hypothetical protein